MTGRRKGSPGGMLEVACAAVLTLLAACGGGEAGDTASSLPVAEPTGAVDEELAERGEELFRTRGCVACHTVGEGRRVGPDLAGLTERRSFAWSYHMVLNPDSMLKNDTTARRLLSEYFTPMTDQKVQPGEFRAMWEHLRSEGREE